MKYNLSKLFKKAWSLYRAAAKKTPCTFSEALKRAWAWLKVQAQNAATIDAAAAAAGLADMELHSWAGWKTLGRQVIHTEKAALQVEIADPLTRSGRRIQSYFTREQTQVTPA